VGNEERLMNHAIRLGALAVALGLGALIACNSTDAVRTTGREDGGAGSPSAGGSGGSVKDGGSGGVDAGGKDGGSGGANGGSDADTPEAGSEAGLASGPDAGSDAPEVILKDPNVEAALAGAEAAGHPLFIHTEHGAPPISGYWSKPDGEGKFVATDDGTSIGFGVQGFEERITVDDSDLVDTASVSFDTGYITASSIQHGLILRGSGNELTLYTRFHSVCPEAGSDFSNDGYSITSAKLDASTGYLLFVRTLLVTSRTYGTPTPGCVDIFVGGTEKVGGWGVSEVPRYIPVTPADLLYMCVDENAGYVEAEEWTRKDGTPCTCASDYSVSCQ
jgi:hypothetical protein